MSHPYSSVILSFPLITSIAALGRTALIAELQLIAALRQRVIRARPCAALQPLPGS